MSRELFGTDGVRGLAGQYPLNEVGAIKIGMAVGTYFAKPNQTVVIASDPRESSADLVKFVSNGLRSVGVNVVSAGVLPTPGLAYTTREGDYVAGVMITASHNPYRYNGIKVFDGNGDKLSDKVEAELNNLIESEITALDSGQLTMNEELIKSYEDFLIKSVAELKLEGVRLGVDAANGAASGLAARLFERLGAEVVSLSDQPDGRNINDNCGATNTANLQRIVKEQKLAFGIAVDGDADRLIMVDEQGREVKGDYIMYILAVTNHLDGVVATVMSNAGFEAALKEKGIKLERAAVGDRYVLEGLVSTGYMLGGEQSGHIIMPQLLKTGDALLAALQTVKAVQESSRGLAEWCDEVELLPQAIVNISLQDKALLDQPAVRDFVEQQNQKLERGRVLIRPSGTEPLVRVMVEAPEAETKAETIANQLSELLK